MANWKQLYALASEFKKIAQTYPDGMSGEEFYKRYDPLSGLNGKMEPGVKVPQNKGKGPTAKQTQDAANQLAALSPQKPNTQVAGPKEQKAQQPERSALPSDMKSLLDIGAPGLKGLLYFYNPRGNVFDVRYNLTRYNGGNARIKQIIENAIGPSFRVGEIVGVDDPQAGFKPNYY